MSSKLRLQTSVRKDGSLHWRPAVRTTPAPLRWCEAGSFECQRHSRGAWPIGPLAHWPGWWAWSWQRKASKNRTELTEDHLIDLRVASVTRTQGPLDLSSCSCASFGSLRSFHVAKLARSETIAVAVCPGVLGRMRSWRFSSGTWTSSGSCQNSPRRCCQMLPESPESSQCRSGCPSGVTGGEPATLGVRLDHPWGARTTRCSGGTLWCYAGRVWRVWVRWKFLWGRSKLWELLALKITRYKRMAARADITLSSSNIMRLQLLSNSVGNWFVVISLVSAPMDSVRIGPFLVITSLGTRGYEMGLVWKVDRPDEGFLYRCFVIWFDLGMGQDVGTIWDNSPWNSESVTCDPAGTVEALLANLQPSNALVTAGHSVWLILRAVGAMLQQLQVVSRSCKGPETEKWSLASQERKLIEWPWMKFFFVQHYQWELRYINQSWEFGMCGQIEDLESCMACTLGFVTPQELQVWHALWLQRPTISQAAVAECQGRSWPRQDGVADMRSSLLAVA